MRERGYYWMSFRRDHDGYTVGYYNPKSSYPWECVGSDEIFKVHEIVAGPKIDVPNLPIFHRDED